MADAPVAASGHPYDPCAMVSSQDVAAAFGVATNQVFTPQRPTANECEWAVAAHTGVPGQQAAFTLQTIDQAKHQSGWKLFSTVLAAARSIPGAPITNATVNNIFDNAQTVANLGDQASWKDRTLSVVKRQLLLQVQVTSTDTDSQSLQIAKSIATSALQHIPDPPGALSANPLPSPSPLATQH
jgi:hypothetical protein